MKYYIARWSLHLAHSDAGVCTYCTLHLASLHLEVQSAIGMCIHLHEMYDAFGHIIYTPSCTIPNWPVGAQCGLRLFLAQFSQIIFF